MKKQIPVEKMCDECPTEFTMFLNYSRGLRFDEMPDYEYLRKMFRDLAKKHGIEYDWKFDWLKQNEDFSDLNFICDTVEQYYSCTSSCYPNHYTLSWDDSILNQKIHSSFLDI